MAPSIRSLPPPIPPSWTCRVPAVNNNLVPPLTDMALDVLAAHPDSITDLSWVAEHLVVGLLYRLMTQGRLNFRLAVIFRDCGHDSIREVIDSLDLLGSMPTYNSLGNPHR